MTGWILSWNPRMFDLERLRADGQELDAWSISRYRQEVQVGERFALWQTGSDGGVIALGVVTGQAFQSKDQPLPYWNEEPGDRWYLAIRVDRWLATPISRRQFMADRDLAGASIIRQSFAGNPHRLDDQQWRALDRLVRESGQSTEESAMLNEDELAMLLVPHISGETDEGPDLLGITPDATALASVLAWRELQLPLAVGLYGEWGSGKSFFMRTIERAVDDLSEAGDPAFCRHIKQVRFSAWHYSEGNLWASLLHSMFAALHGEEAADPLVVDAMAAAERAEEAERKADRAAQQAEKKVEDAERARDAAKSRRETAPATETISPADILKEVSGNDEVRKRLTEVFTELGLVRAVASGRELIAAFGSMREIATRATTLATVPAGKRWWTSPAAAALLAAVLAAIMGLALGIVLDAIGHGALSGLIGVVTEIATIGSAAAAWLNQKADLARKALQYVEDAKRNIEERQQKADEARVRDLEAAEQALRDAERARDEARERQAQVSAELKDAKAELARLTGPQRLLRYIAERAGSDDYSRHLGIVATVHRDLRKLEDLIRTGRDGKAPIDRIVLYIDDLDRCPPRKVVKVLETVHLLLAQPLFAVVVGVDPRWLCRSLRVAHPELVADPHDYLDKIFQFTFTMPPMTAGICAEYLVATAGAAPEQPAPTLDTHSASVSGEVVASADKADDATELAAALALHDIDRETFPLVAPLVMASPRRAKRFGNVYRLVKARAYADVIGRALLDGEKEEHGLQCLMLTLAISLGLPETARRMWGGQQTTLREELAAAAGEAHELARVEEFLRGAGSLGDLGPSDLAPWWRIVGPFTPSAVS